MSINPVHIDVQWICSIIAVIFNQDRHSVNAKNLPYKTSPRIPHTSNVPVPLDAKDDDVDAQTFLNFTFWH